MSNTLNLGNGKWARKKGSLLAYNSENNNYKPLPFTFDRDSVATRVNKQGLIETVGADQPRIDYLNDSNGALLLEPSRTNLITYSEDFSQWATQSGGTGSAPIITSNSAISPDGTQNAHKIVFNKGTGVSTSDLSVIASSSFTTQTNTASFYIKADSPQKIVFRNSTNWQLVDVTTEWQRIDKTDTGNGVQIGLRDGYGISGVPNTATIYLWGAQVESNSYPTSYIPTQGSAVTRVEETCTNGGNDQVINSTEGVLYLEAKVKTDTIFAANCVAVSDGTDANRLSIIMYGNINSIRASMNVGSVSQFDFNLPSGYSQEQYYKIAVSYKANDCKIFINGAKILTDTSATMPSLGTFDRLNLDLGQGLYDFYGNVKDVRVYNTALTDQELASLTQV